MFWQAFKGFKGRRRVGRVRVAAALLSLAIAVSCGVPGAGIGGSPTPTGIAGTRQALLSARLVDVRDGGTFALRDFGGKVVIVLGIAVW